MPSVDSRVWLLGSNRVVTQLFNVLVVGEYTFPSKVNMLLSAESRQLIADGY